MKEEDRYNITVVARLLHLKIALRLLLDNRPFKKKVH
jgi:hypothetical protein